MIDSATPDENLRLECLRLALTNFTGSARDVVRDAHAFHDFVTGKADASPREKITAALDEAGVA